MAKKNSPPKLLLELARKNEEEALAIFNSPELRALCPDENWDAVAAISEKRIVDIDDIIIDDSEFED